MDCLVCNKTGPIYRLVDGDVVGICEQCVAEHVSPNVGSATCLYCGEAGDYDLVEFVGAVTAAGEESREDYEVVTENVVCRDHLSELRREDA
ncbi:hypothetical protein [Halobacterium wangiae]|uniref:hypothetical protein n=1 Tax=Halobacterium wangiae TaxID=2902623 RepID=UPI001E3EC144|nr:hypothetical protein [Halobacterium wangiae]